MPFHFIIHFWQPKRQTQDMVTGYCTLGLTMSEELIANSFAATTSFNGWTSQDCASPLKVSKLCFILLKPYSLTTYVCYKFWNDIIFPGHKVSSCSSSIFHPRQSTTSLRFSLLIRWVLYCWMQFATKHILKMPILMTWSRANWLQSIKRSYSCHQNTSYLKTRKTSGSSVSIFYIVRWR